MDIKLKNNNRRIEKVYIVIVLAIISIIISVQPILKHHAILNESSNAAGYFETEKFYFEMFGNFENIYSDYIYKIKFEERNNVSEYNKATDLFENVKLRYNRESLYDRPSSNVKYMILDTNTGKWGGSLTARQRDEINIANYHKLSSLDTYIKTLEKDMKYLWHIKIDSQGILKTEYTSGGIRYSNEMYRRFCEEYRIRPLTDVEIIYMVTKEPVTQDELYSGIERYKYYGHQDPIILVGVIGLVVIIILGLTYPNKYIDKEGKIYKYNKIPLETKVLLLGMGVVCFITYINIGIGISTENLTRQVSQRSTIAHEAVESILMGINIFLLVLAYISIYINSRYIRNAIQTGVKESLLNSFWSIRNKEYIMDTIKKPYQFLSIKTLGIVFIILNFIVISSVSILGLRGIGVGLVYSIMIFGIVKKYLKDIQRSFNKLKKFTSEIEQGNLEVQIEEDLGIFSVVGDNLIKVKEGFKQAVEKEVKSERMKTELISNVSHDLKTPLTSIINYVDLLKSSKLDEETRLEYIQILDSKSKRLQILIEDLFEVSKAASGNLTLELQEIDIVALMNQVIGELKDKIDKSGLIFKRNFPLHKVMVLLDGRRIVRVIENLIGNSIKYAMPGSRVFIDILEETDNIIFIIKNIAAEEMNFTPEDIVERFNRGDKSRSTEGSGLGLAISRSLVELQGGDFEVIIDGDLFKVVITFKK